MTTAFNFWFICYQCEFKDTLSDKLVKCRLSVHLTIEIWFNDINIH